MPMSDVPGDDSSHPSVGWREGTDALTVSEVSGEEFRDLAARSTPRIGDDFDEMAFRLGFSLTRVAAAAVHESEAQVHRPHGWSFSAFRVMYIIWIFDRVEARHIARLAGVSRQSTSSVLATLERNGFVRRERDECGDRRLVSIELTDEGRRAVQQAFVAQHRLDRAWFGVLSPQEQQQLLDLLDRVGEAIARTIRGDDQAGSADGDPMSVSRSTS